MFSVVLEINVYAKSLNLDVNVALIMGFSIGDDNGGAKRLK